MGLQDIFTSLIRADENASWTKERIVGWIVSQCLWENLGCIPSGPGALSPFIENTACLTKWRWIGRPRQRGNRGTVQEDRRGHPWLEKSAWRESWSPYQKDDDDSDVSWWKNFVLRSPSIIQSERYFWSLVFHKSLLVKTHSSKHAVYPQYDESISASSQRYCHFPLFHSLGHCLYSIRKIVRSPILSKDLLKALMNKLQI